MFVCWLFMARRFLPVVPMPSRRCVPVDRSVLPLLQWWRGLDTCAGEGQSFGRASWLQRICSKCSWSETVWGLFFGPLWAALGQWVYLQVGSRKLMLWVSWIWTMLLMWTLGMLLKMGNIDRLRCEHLLSWILKCFLKINGKTPFGFKGGRSRSRAMFIFTFFNASVHSGGVCGKLETCASSRSTWLHWVGWGLQALLAGELLFLQSNRISEA